MAQELTIPIELYVNSIAGTWTVDGAGVLHHEVFQPPVSDDFDALRLRREFLALKPHPRDLIRWLNRNRLYEFATPINEGTGVAELNARDLLEWKELIAHLLVTPISKWSSLPHDRAKLNITRAIVEGGFVLHFEMIRGIPKAIGRTQGGLIPGLIVSVYLDRVRGEKFRRCKRSDCPNVFRADYANKEYCQQYCAHLSNLRKNRDEARQRKRTEDMKKMRKGSRARAPKDSQ
jgi:hypothetical protein